LPADPTPPVKNHRKIGRMARGVLGPP
jgi:hypothetical protein